jgi:hypothetical protein
MAAIAQPATDYSATLARILNRDFANPAISDGGVDAMVEEDQADIAALAASDAPLAMKAKALLQVVDEDDLLSCKSIPEAWLLMSILHKLVAA